MKKTSKYSFKKEDLSKFIETVKTGSKQESKEAKKQIESFWHNFYIDNRKDCKDAFKQFLDEINHFDDICDLDHQVYFLGALKWAIWAIGDEYFENWVSFILKCMENPSGRIRQSTIYAISPLNMGLNLPGKYFSITNDHPDEFFEHKQLIDIVKFGFYAYSTARLMEKYFQPKFKKYKYVSSLPTSEYKSLQKLMMEEILRSEHYEHIYEWFLHFFRGRCQRVYSGDYLFDLKFLLNLVNEDDCDIINLINKSKKKDF